jgi:hypothetical protein
MDGCLARKEEVAANEDGIIILVIEGAARGVTGDCRVPASIEHSKGQHDLLFLEEILCDKKRLRVRFDTTTFVPFTFEILLQSLQQAMEVRMRTVIVLSAILVVVAIGLGVKTIFISNPSISAPGMSPYGLHLDHPNMKDMPVLEIKDLI